MSSQDLLETLVTLDAKVQATITKKRLNKFDVCKEESLLLKKEGRKHQIEASTSETKALWIDESKI